MWKRLKLNRKYHRWVQTKITVGAGGIGQNSCTSDQEWDFKGKNNPTNPSITTRTSYLQSPSGISSRLLLAAMNSTRLDSFPTPDGTPSKSSLFEFKYSFFSLDNLQIADCKRSDWQIGEDSWLDYSSPKYDTYVCTLKGLLYFQMASVARKHPLQQSRIQWFQCLIIWSWSCKLGLDADSAWLEWNLQPFVDKNGHHCSADCFAPRHYVPTLPLNCGKL